MIVFIFLVFMSFLTFFSFWLGVPLAYFICTWVCPLDFNKIAYLLKKKKKEIRQQDVCN
jgi:polyferredoxin